MDRPEAHRFAAASPFRSAMRVQFSAGADRVTRAYPTLSPQLKKCAAYILEHPSEVATLSMRQVAARAEVPPSTMTRLAQAVGFTSYNHLRDVYRESINSHSTDPSPNAGQQPAGTGKTDSDQAVDTYRRAALRNLNAVFDQIEPSVLDRAVRALATASRVFVAGSLESYSAANYLHGLVAAGLQHWRLATRHNGDFDILRHVLSQDDAVIAIALEPWAADTIQLARHARENGARVLGITDRRTSPLAAISNDLLLVRTGGPSFFQSYVAVTALVEVLAGMVVEHTGNATISTIDELERLRHKTGVYWEE